MKRRAIVIAVMLLVGFHLAASTIGAPAATVRLTKTTPISMAELNAEVAEYQQSAKAAGQDNKLMDALTNNPEESMLVMTKLADNLYSALMDKMKSSSLSSALTVYNDKEMAKTLTNYKSDLAKMESRLLEIEEKYYRQFAAMETAMARMNSQSSALMSMLGMTNNQNY